jgi:hypothetical protein
MHACMHAGTPGCSSRALFPALVKLNHAWCATGARWLPAGGPSRTRIGEPCSPGPPGVCGRELGSAAAAGVTAALPPVAAVAAAFALGALAPNASEWSCRCWGLQPGRTGVHRPCACLSSAGLMQLTLLQPSLPEVAEQQSDLAPRILQYALTLAMACCVVGLPPAAPPPGAPRRGPFAPPPMPPPPPAAPAICCRLCAMRSSLARCFSSSSARRRASSSRRFASTRRWRSSRSCLSSALGEALGYAISVLSHNCMR